MKKKIISKNFLHTHPYIQKKLGLDNEHVIVDRKDLEEVWQFFDKNPEQVEKISK